MLQREFSTLLNDKLNDIKYITMNNEFETLCLNRLLLETASIRHHRYHKNFKELSNYSTSKFYNQKYALKKITIFLRKLCICALLLQGFLYNIRSFIIKYLSVSENILSIRHVQINRHKLQTNAFIVLLSLNIFPLCRRALK